ncbi:PQQ-dependent sugar dehydrogenase [Methanosphaerula palustris]|nr:PQQ-dependent sugar dehydrogenase [Methanosphaerula palustris]
MVLLLFMAAAGCSKTGSSTGTQTITPGSGNGTDIQTTVTPGESGGQPAYMKDQSSYSVLSSGNASGTVGLKQVADGLTAPIALVSSHDDTGRLFAVDQTGVVRIIDKNGVTLPTPFLDLRDRMVTLSQTYDERGLLGIAFHPDYKNNGRIFVFYSAPLRDGGPDGWNCTNRLSEFKVSSTDPNQVDMSSERILLTIDKPSMNHNGGPILFGPDDGYLYLTTGDGGGANDVGLGHTTGTGNAQDLKSLLGKVLRIDVNQRDEGLMYAIPKDNPFVNKGWALPEIYAYGLRNPAYATFDSGDGHTLFIGDAGQQLFESVYQIKKGGNYGWNLKEGTHSFNPSQPGTPNSTVPTVGSRGESLTDPIIELGHDLGLVVVGGYVYRGTAIPGLTGKYLFGDWSESFTIGNGTLLLGTPPAINGTGTQNGMWSVGLVNISTSQNGRVNGFVRGFGEDDQHELYLLTSQASGPSGTTGKIYQITAPTAVKTPTTP